MPTPIATPTVCSICREPLRGQRDCLPCLLRGGLDQANETSSALVFGEFEIERRADGALWELGHGTMGVTYRARDQVLHRAVALKVIDLPTDATEAQTARERFLREARAAAVLRHPNVAGVFQFGALPQIGGCYYAMELVEGETLETRVRRDGPLEARAALEMARQVAGALVAAAAHGLIHRDLKPANIMLMPKDSGTEVKVIDFGLAKVIAESADEMDLTHGAFVGTPTFASPEQFLGKAADARSDIYSLGATLWYALTGEVPYPGRTIEEIRSAQEKLALPIEQLAARKVPPPLIGLLRCTLANDPSERPPSARVLAGDLESCRAAMAARPRRWLRGAAAILFLLLVGAISLTSAWWWQPSPAAREKSIAVLPFENLSADGNNAFFAAGIQDDVLTSLAQIHELKVISRTSVMAYQKGTRNMREISRALGVENVLEGSVRREGNRILLNVQLIDARHDHHIWAKHYDRTEADSIGLQGELAAEIAAALEARLAPAEKARLATKPTNNPAANALYLRALGRERTVNNSQADFLAAERLYAEAVGLDPGFALAHARRSIVNSYLGETGEYRAQARKSANEAVRLSPSLGEAHLALGLCLYWFERDYTKALLEFSRAAATAPNEPDVLTYIAGIYRRQGLWRESLAAYQRAQDLDPRNRRVVSLAAVDYLLVRDWASASACFNRALQMAPDSARARIGLAYLEIFRHSDPAAARRILDEIPPGIDPDGEVTEARWDLAMLGRDYAAAEKILVEFRSESFARADGAPKTFFLGRVALARGDGESAQRSFTAALPEIEAWVREHPSEAQPHAIVGLVYAYLERKEDAIREGRRAIELEPESQNAFHGATQAANLALIYARTGEADLAINLIKRLLATPGPVEWPDHPENMTLADLRLRWDWDPLRSDPRFAKILASSEPKTLYH